MAGDINDDQVLYAFDMLLDELGKSHEAVARELTPAGRRSDYQSVDDLKERLQTIDDVQRAVAVSREQWRSIASSGQYERNPQATVIPEAQSPAAIQESVIALAPKTGRSDHGRLEQGRRTLQDDFGCPILTALVERGGQGRRLEVLKRVQEIMEHVLTRYDYESMPTKEHLERWVETADWCRHDMVHKHGLLVKDSPTGIWQISDRGRAYLRDNCQ